jgi:hypothetical protein
VGTQVQRYIWDGFVLPGWSEFLARGVKGGVPNVVQKVKPVKEEIPVVDLEMEIPLLAC